MRRSLQTIVLVVFTLLANYQLTKGQLSGPYTIDASGTASGTTYLNFSSAVSDLAFGTRTDGGAPNGPGVSGAVTFTVSTGTYNESISIPQITGASATNTITFDGVNPATRLIQTNSTSSGGSVIQLNGADFIRIRNLGITNTGTSDGYGIQLVANANNNEVTGCDISVNPNGTSTDQIGIILGTSYTSYALHGTNLLIQDNTISGGYLNIAANGPSGTQAGGVIIDGNDLEDAYFSAFRLNYLRQFDITNNNIDLRTQYLYAYGMYLRYCSEFEISNNVVSNPGAYGIYQYYTNYNTTATSTVFNNMIGGNFRSTGTSYGFYHFNCRTTNTYHNSLLLDNPGSGARGLYVSGSQSTGLDFRNNSFAVDNVSAAAYPIYIVNPSYVQTLDYNNYYGAGGTVGRIGSLTFNTLAAMQTSYTQFNANSQVGWPNYVSSSDLHTIGPPLSNWAVNIPAINTDIDGQSRPLPPDPTKDVGADEFNIPPFDLDLTAIVSPVVLGIGNNTVTVELTNNGANSLNGQNLTLQYSTDGGTTWGVTENYSPTALGAPGATENFTFTTPWNVTTAGNYTICVRVNPQIAGDPDSQDQICSNVCTGMGGNYTINSALPTGGTNYNSFSDAAAALNSCGIVSSVVFNVAAGSYNETVELTNIPGTSASNTVTFDGGSVASCTLTYTFTTSNQAVVHLDGTDYVSFRNITVDIPGSFGYGFWFQNGADYNSITDCQILMPLQSTSVYHIGVLFSGALYYNYGNTGNFNTIDNNVISGGYYGIRMNGVSTTDFVDGNVVTNNSITEFYYYGYYGRYVGYPDIRNNLFTARTAASVSSYGIYAYYCGGDFRIEDNTIHSVGLRGIYLYYGNFNNTGRGRVINNMIGANFTGSSSSAWGLYMYNVKDTDIYHNSVDLGFKNGNAMYVSGSSTNGSDSLRFVNNIFVTRGSGQAIYVSSSALSGIQEMDYNLYSTSGNSVAYFGTTYATLAALQAANNNFHQNSIVDDPGFVGQTDLHIVCSPIDNLGTAMGITEDIDDETRNMVTPDIGADEFTSIVITYDVGPDTLGCDDYTVWADTNNYVGYIWGGGQTTPFLYVDSTGYYSVTVIDSNNCRATDSLFVTINDLPLAPFNNDTISQCSYDTIDALNVGSSYLWNTNDTTQSIVPGASGTYSVTITSPDGCVLNDQITLNLFADAVAQLGPDTSFCLGGSATLNAGTGPVGTNYTWSTGATSQVVVISAPGTFTVTVTTPQGCSASDEITLSATQPPVVSLGPDSTFCDDFTLDPGNVGTTYSWSTGATSQSISGTVSGTYSVTVTDVNGCSETDDVNILVRPTPNVDLGLDKVVCANQPVTLDAGFPGFIYQWSTLATTQTITVNTPGSYFVQVTDPGSGCMGMDTINLNGSFLTANLGPDFSLCNGTSATLDAGSGAAAYLWNDGSTAQTLQINQAGTYIVQVADGFGCVDTDTINVNAAVPPTATISGPNTTAMLQNIQFNGNSANTNVTYSWDFGDGNTSNQQNPTHQYQAMGSFQVCLTVSNGLCATTTCQDVTVSAPVGVEDALFAQSVNVYPNPNNGSFSVSFDLPKALDLRVEVYAVTGQKLVDRELNAVRALIEDVDISDYAKGMYFLKITSDKGNEMIRKVIVE